MVKSRRRRSVASWLNHRAFQHQCPRRKIRVIPCNKLQIIPRSLWFMEYSLSAALVYTAARSFAHSRPCIPRARGSERRGRATTRASRGVSAVVIVADVRKHWNPFTFRACGNPAPRGAHNRVTRRCKFSKEFLRVIRFRARARCFQAGWCRAQPPKASH